MPPNHRGSRDTHWPKGCAMTSTVAWTASLSMWWRFSNTLGVDVAEASLSDESIRGVAIAGPRHRSGIVWNRNNRFNADARGRRFTLAHELCHLLFDRSVGQRLAVASGPRAPPSLEQRANAFAAMLLMPTETVRTVVANMNEPIASRQGVESVADRMEAGFSATLWHLRNLGFVDDSSVQRIEAEGQPH